MHYTQTIMKGTKVALDPTFHVPISPVQGFMNFDSVPRALPWADICQAFGLEHDAMGDCARTEKPTDY
jgi:hypothetical protein